MSSAKLGRNDACSCGSGKKYKHCCGPKEAAAGSLHAQPRSGASTDWPARLIALAKANRYPEMETLANQAMGWEPNSGLAWKALSVSLQMQGKTALDPAIKAAQLLPNDPDCHNNLGAEFRRLGRLDEAMRSYGRALDLRPEVPELWNNFGNVQKDLGRLGQAIESYGRALRLQPNFAKALSNLGIALQSAGRFGESEAHFRQAIALEPNHPDFQVNLGILLRLQSRTPEAEACGQKALAMDPLSIPALQLLAELRSDRGEFDAAEQLLKRAMDIAPDSPEPWAAIAGLRRMTLRDGHWLAGALRLAETSQGSSAVPLRFALGKYFDDVGDYDQAFTHYRLANDAATRTRPPHDRAAVAAGVDRIMATYDLAWLKRATAGADVAQRAVFVVGMPRSGTTLAEQILASHSEVCGAGELPFWNTTAERFMASPDEDPASMSRRNAAHYLELLAALSNDATKVVDKMPGNFLHLGLIHAALPNAKIIHMRRDPIDTCLSIYFQNFGALHPYANDLADLADYYRQYERIMDHWRRTLPPGAMLEVKYEDLIEQTELSSRRMLHFLSLPWQSGCLEFHQTKRIVNTFSKWQARQKIHRSSVGRWRHYEKYIGPLLSLGESRSPQ